MKQYSVYVDIMAGRDSNEVQEVVGLEVEASNKDEAYIKAKEVADTEFEYYYIWEVMEEDEISDVVEN